MHFSAKPRLENCTVIIPTMNEQENIQRVVKGASPVFGRMIVSDSSSDGTAEAAKKANPAAIVIRSPGGKGRQLRRGIELALQHKPEFIALMDGDGEILPEDFYSLMEAMEESGADLVFGARKKERSRSRGFLNWFASYWLNLATGYGLEDCLAGCVLAKSNALGSLRLKSDNFEFEVELLLAARKSDLEVASQEIGLGTFRKSGVNLRNMVQINNFYDRWVLENFHELKIPRGRKAVLLLSAGIGILAGSAAERLLRLAGVRGNK